jgi:UDP:flavonoid glycosyltransferase YjiC (YdhE family)
MAAGNCRVLCVSAQLPGHLDWGGYLATAAELVGRGVDVLWASGAAVRRQVEARGVPFHTLAETGWRWPPPPPLPPSADADPHALLLEKQERSLDQWLDVARVTQAGDELANLAHDFRPHLILTEMFVAAAGLVAERLETPLAVIGWPAPSGRASTTGTTGAGATGADTITATARARLETLCARFGLQGVNFAATGPPALCAPALHLTYWSESWFAGAVLGPQTVHAGGLKPDLPADFAPDPGLPSPDDAPWVLVTLGTSFNADPNFFIAAAHAVDQMGCLPLAATGAPLDAPWVTAMRPRLPRRTVLAPWLPFARVLPFVAAAIHHGGAGTTHALVTHAVPQIVAPHAADQARQAQGIMRTGVGRFLPAQDVTVPRLVDTLAEALPDRSPLRSQAQALQAEFHALGGVPAAARQLADFVRAYSGG